MTRWRYIVSEGVGAAEGLAFDEAMMLGYGRGGKTTVPASLRLYRYRPHCALVGRYQSLAEEVDLDYCQRHGIEVGRRPTGGGAIIMGPGQLGVALAAPAGTRETPRQTLRRYAGAVVAGLAELGIEARFRSKNDLETGGRKIAGLGLYLDPRGAVLFHCSLLVDLDVPLMLRVLRIPGAKLSDKAVLRIAERVTTVRRESGEQVGIAAAREAVAAGFSRRFETELVPGELDAEERQRRDELVRTRFGNREWIHQRGPRRDARGSSMLKTPAGLLRIFVAVQGEVIKSALITGDFNLLPPGIPRLESLLRWRRAEPERVRAAAAEALTADDLGVEPEAVGEAVWEAARRALELERSAHPLRPAGSCYFPERECGAAAGRAGAEKGAG